MIQHNSLIIKEEGRKEVARSQKPGGRSHTPDS
jgi:hypothetical protein